jgi:hypothetical protein
MRSVLILSFVLYTANIALSQQLPVKEGKVFYEVIDSSIQGTKQELQVKAKMWMANAFKDAKEVVQMDDKEAGEVLGKGNFNIGYFNMHCRFTIKISTRDNKYRCQIYDMSIVSPNGQASKPMEYYAEHPKGMGSKKTIESTDEGIHIILHNLQDAMKKSNDNF